jgi:hypothetical protein
MEKGETLQAGTMARRCGWLRIQVDGPRIQEDLRV